MRQGDRISSVIALRRGLGLALLLVVAVPRMVFAQAEGTPALLPKIEVDRCTSQERFVFAAHGGAVFIRNQHPAKIAFLEALLPETQVLLAAGATALDVVHAAMIAMEDSSAFNAGKGSIANQAGEVEMDASIMDGSNRAAGAVASVKGLKNPVDAARIVMERSPHVMMVGPGAESFVTKNGGAAVNLDYFKHGGGNFSDVPLPQTIDVARPGDAVPSERAAFSGLWAGVWQGQTNQVLAVEKIEGESATVVYAIGVNEYWGLDEGYWVRIPATFVEGGLQFQLNSDSGNWTLTYTRGPADRLNGVAVRQGDGLSLGLSLKRWNPSPPEAKGGTVGAVALDRCGDLAAATSTGGFGSKTPGRVGDSPVIGAGTYADNRWAAVSATGYGEIFIRRVAAYDLIALMRYQGLKLEQAAEELFRDGELRGGMIAVDKAGNVAMPFSTVGMVRGVVREVGKPVVSLY